MESQLSQDPLDSLIPQPDMSAPTTPQLSQTSIPESTAAAVSKVQASRIDSAPTNMTPPPSTQVQSSSRPKTRTPTPPISHISTPPPTVELPTDSQRDRLSGGGLTTSMSATELMSASPEELRTKVTELQGALQEAKMSAAHHKLQYQMLSQESAAAIERMVVEQRMAQYENEVIHNAEQARAAATPQPSPAQEGMVPVQKELYQGMCRELQQLREANHALYAESQERQIRIDHQDDEIASLSDKVTLMRERIHETREKLHKYRRPQISHHVDSTPRTMYGTPDHHHRSHPSSQPQPQRFAALLQASEMASQESARSAPARGLSGKKGHSRNMHSTSSLPSTPQRVQKVQYETPSMRHQPLKVPSTAPVPRTSAMRTPDVYHQSLPMSQSSAPAAPQSDGTVSASDNDSEAETDIIDEDDAVNESQASRAASQMLRTSQEQQQAKRDSFKGSGMLEPKKSSLKQTKLFGAVRKANVDRSEGPPAKRARTSSEAVGLGIAGMR